MIKPPRVLRLIGQRYPIRFHAAIHIHDEQGNTVTEAANGFTDRNTGEIGLHLGLGPDVERVVMLHEVLHAIVGATGMHQDILSEGGPVGGTEEQVVNRLTPILLAVLQDNPKLYEYLTDRRVLGAGSATWFERNTR